MSSVNALLNKMRYKRKDTPSKSATNATNKQESSVYSRFRTSRLAQVNPSTFTCSHNAREEGTVAVLFIIVDKFPHENIWREWLEAKSAIAAATRIRVLIHAKFPEKVTSDWVRARLVTSFHYTPEWGHSDLVRVMLGLMKEITNTEPTVCKAIFASESCLPIVPAEHFLSLATRDGDSWVNFTNDSKNGFVQQKQFDPLLRVGFPKNCVYKSDQWTMLSRAHMLEILSCPSAIFGGDNPTTATATATAPSTAVPTTAPSGLPTAVFHDNRAENMLLDKAFAQVSPADEMYVASTLRLCGLIPDLVDNKLATAPTPLSTPGAALSCPFCRSTVRRKASTYVVWDATKQSQGGYFHPEATGFLDREKLLEARICNNQRLCETGAGGSRVGNIHYDRLRAAARLDSYNSSTLFARKVVVSTDEQRDRLLCDWKLLVLQSGAENSTQSGEMPSSASSEADESSTSTSVSLQTYATDSCTESVGRKRKADDAELAALES